MSASVLSPLTTSRVAHHMPLSPSQAPSPINCYQGMPAYTSQDLLFPKDQGGCRNPISVKPVSPLNPTSVPISVQPVNLVNPTSFRQVQRHPRYIPTHKWRPVPYALKHISKVGLWGLSGPVTPLT